MSLKPNKPLLYLITSGATTPQTTSSTEEFSRILKLIESAVDAQIDLVQIREKRLTTRVLFELASRAASITRGTGTQLLINDRADVASAAGADGVHLTTQSVPADVVRSAFGQDVVIGVSTHSLDEAVDASQRGADFIVFGPVFDTVSKRSYGEPLGIDALAEAVSTLPDLPVIALGGIDLHSVGDCARAGAAGVGAIRMFDDPARLSDIAKEVRSKFAEGLS
jgi:thiamine-phosphate pyrophosphorylase